MTVQKLGDICELKYGSSLPATARTGEAFPVFGSNGKVGTHERALTRGATIVVGRKGSVGEINYSDGPCWPIDTTYFVDETCTQVHLRWLHYAMDGLRLGSLNKATGVPGLNRNDAYERELFVPAPDEQKRIAAILDQADDLRRKRQRAIDRLGQLGQAIFHDLFVEGTGNWPEKLLAEVVTPGTIVTYGIVQAGDEFPGGVPYVRTGDIKDGQIVTEGLRHTDPAIAAKFERSRVRSGEIVMSIRATVGTVAFVPYELDGANLTQGTARISPGPDVMPWYLIEYLRSPSAQSWIEKQVKGATFREITLTRLREMMIPLPPEPMQKRFSDAMDLIHAQRALAVNALRHAEAMFASLQHRAFRGDV